MENTSKQTFFLHPGYIFVCEEPYLISTVLGSCVSVCIWDSFAGIGGMNHHIHAKPFKAQERSSQYGSLALPHMIAMLKSMGGSKINFRAHIVGGSQNSLMGSSIIGKENINIAEKILRENYIQIVTVDTGGEMGRKVVFDTETGELAVYKVNKLRDTDWYDNKSLNYR
jgi:chemotaxis protein CheD